MYLMVVTQISSGKESACQCRRCKRLGFYPWLRKMPWLGNGNPLQYSCLEISMDRGAWQTTVHDVTKKWTWLNVHTHTHTHTHTYSHKGLKTVVWFLAVICLLKFWFTSISSYSGQGKCFGQEENLWPCLSLSAYVFLLAESYRQAQPEAGGLRQCPPSPGSFAEFQEEGWESHL